METPAPTPRTPALIDRFGRRVSYLRLSVTDRCDLRCSYCMPKGFSGFEEPDNWLRFDEITRVVATFARMGVSRLRMTGGEPLLRRHLPQLVTQLSGLPGLQDISLSTNATQLHKHAQALRAAGVSRINVSLDSLDKACMEQITGRDSFASIMAGLRAGKDAGFDPIKLNMVVMRGVNDHEIMRMAQYCFEEGFILRLIEAMPMGDTGRNSQYMDVGPIREQLVHTFNLLPAAAELGGGPARYWSTQDGKGTIGFISPISQHFCATCNRVRLSVDGTLYMCLGQEEKFELRPLLRAGVSDDELESAIRTAIELKPERHEFKEQPHKIIRFMSQTGG
ncbi:MAG: GTP 3',8-cyclase MoaA [Undibacterium sp.]|uniref:GTP 3',8-cyclase MoaA n=1 Tax=Undibacterium sp. TaxID=1914977 RepID=UPI002728130A|nr:GTP 3',8-cyclase MoaA [Undibacterium sp.]MDO8654145.1 GTP 3',8-cyclase MoaA [Undibacterium sp.]